MLIRFRRVGNRRMNNMYPCRRFVHWTTFPGAVLGSYRSDIHGTGNPVIPYDIDDDVANPSRVRLASICDQSGRIYTSLCSRMA